MPAAIERACVADSIHSAPAVGFTSGEVFKLSKSVRTPMSIPTHRWVMAIASSVTPISYALRNSCKKNGVSG